MPVNASARLYKIEVQIPNGSSLDVTQACSGDSSGYLVLNESEPDQTGIVTITGKLCLDALAMKINSYGDMVPWSDAIDGETFLDEDVFDPDINSQRWAIGNFIRIQVANDSGELVPYVRDYLRILKTPLEPYPGNMKLEIEIGDDLTLLNWRSPDDDKSGVQTGTLTGRGSIISNLLAAAGFNNGINASWSGEIDSFALSHKVPKLGGSYIEQAGKLAFGGRSVLWQNKNKQVTAKQIDLNPPSPWLEVTLGQDEIDYKPTQGNERPCSKVQVVGVGYELQERKDSGETTTNEYATRASVPEQIKDQQGQIITVDGGPQEILVRVTIESWSWNSDGNIFTRITDIYESRGLVVPDSFYWEIDDLSPVQTYTKEGSPYVRIHSEHREEKSFYGPDGLLSRKETHIDRLNGKELADYYRGLALRFDPFDSSQQNGLELLGVTSFIQMLRCESIYEKFRYNGTQVIDVETVSYGLLGAVAGSSTDWSDYFANIPNGTDWVLKGKTTQTWEEYNKNEWKKIDRERSTGTTQGTVAVMRSLVRTKDQTTWSNSGQNQPAAGESKPAKFNKVEKELRGTATFEPVAGSDYAPRERSYKIDYLTSSSQCEELAEILGTFLQTSFRGFQLTTAFTDQWFSYSPLSRIDVTYPGRWTKTGLTRGVTWVLAADRAVVTTSCMKLGTVETVETEDGPVSVIRKLYRVRRTIAARQGQGAIATLGIPYESGTIIAAVGQGQGATVTLGSPIVPIVDISASVGQGQGAIAALGTPISNGGGSGGEFAWWKFENSTWSEEIAGRSLEIVYGNNQAVPTIVTGYSGNAVSFPDSLCGLRRVDNDLSINTGDWRIEFYYQFSSFVTGRGLVSLGDSAISEMEMLTTSGNKLLVNIYDSNYNSNQLISSVAMSNNTWYSVVVERSGSTLSLSIDDTSTSRSLNLTPYVSQYGAQIYIGRAIYTSGIAGTMIDELKIYKH